MSVGVVKLGEEIAVSMNHGTRLRSRKERQVTNLKWSKNRQRVVIAH